VNFNLSDVQRSWQVKARTMGVDLPEDASASDTIAAAARAGLIDQAIDVLSAVVAVEALAQEQPAPAMAFAVHSALVLGLSRSAAAPQPVRSAVAALLRGETVGAVALSSEHVPAERDGRLTGRASWVAPLTPDGFVVVGGIRAGGDGTVPEPVACAAWLSAPATAIEAVDTAGLRGVVCGHVDFADAPCVVLGPTLPLMATVRILLAAAGLGMGRRALRESLQAARRLERTGPAGEQTVQGLLADTATELDAAMLLTWKAAAAGTLSLAEASMAKLAATEATQHAVARATQVVGGDSFQQGHAIERLARDVRALELFAGRTEALRDAVAMETLPRG
jgi:alkylation response protein AidB-like acyl-CoA dehydrogenase